MKILVTGGAGDMGSKTVEDLALKEDVELIAVAVDAADHKGLVEVMQGQDVVASALGPFFLFETRLVKAALEAGVDYISICDDWSAAQDTIIRFDGPARSKGRKVITGCGVSPGMSNVAVRYLADKLDHARRADINVYMPIESGEGEAVTQHTLFIFGTVVPVFRDGATIMLPAGSVRRTVEFPRFGRLKVWNIGHGEPVTVPRRIERMAKLALKLPLPHSNLPVEGALRIDVSGEKDSKPVTLTVCGTGTMRDATGIALSIGARLLAAGKLTIEEGGVYGPEGCFDPADFLGMMADSGIRAYTDLEMTEPVN